MVGCLLAGLQAGPATETQSLNTLVYQAGGEAEKEEFLLLIRLWIWQMWHHVNYKVSPPDWNPYQAILSLNKEFVLAWDFFQLGYNHFISGEYTRKICRIINKEQGDQFHDSPHILYELSIIFKPINRLQFFNVGESLAQPYLRVRTVGEGLSWSPTA